MQTVNIRQLKTNPSTALAAARADDMVVVMNRDHPQALLVDLEQLGVPDLAAVRVALAVSLFRNGAVSAGFAARVASMPLAQMLTLLSSQGIALTGAGQADAQEAREEMRTAHDWLAKPASK
jgi:antitoxin (DNA-binding transcriptional repressor) of toxin-antitoxin stability system